MTASTARPVAIVTGGSRGIGRAVAVTAASRGYDVAIACRSDASDVEDAVDQAGGRCLVVRGDLSRMEAIESLAAASTRFGDVALLVNNAGMSSPGGLEHLTPEVWSDALALNLTAPTWLSKLLAVDLARTSGSIVNVSSIGAIIGSSQGVPYGASKAGMLGLTKTLARTLAPRVRVNSVCPGPIASELFEASVTPEHLAAVMTDTPLGRPGTPEEVARVIMDVSEWTYCTGQTIVVDGGRVRL